MRWHGGAKAAENEIAGGERRRGGLIALLSLAKLGHGREDYHLQAVGADAGEYYSERGRSRAAGSAAGLRPSARAAGLIAHASSCARLARRSDPERRSPAIS